MSFAGINQTSAKVFAVKRTILRALREVSTASVQIRLLWAGTKYLVAPLKQTFAVTSLISPFPRTKKRWSFCRKVATQEEKCAIIASCLHQVLKEAPFCTCKLCQLSKRKPLSRLGKLYRKRVRSFFAKLIPEMCFWQEIRTNS